MHLESRVAELLAGLELLPDVRIAGSGDEGGEPVETRYDPVLDLPGPW